MYLKPMWIRRYKKNRKFSVGMMLKRNPAVLLGATLPFVIATGVSLRAAAAMSFEFAMINLGVTIVLITIGKRLAYWKRAILFVGVSTLLMMVARYTISLILPDVYNNQRTYLYLMALNGMILLQTGHKGDERVAAVKWRAALKGFLMHTATFSALMFVVSLPREYFGTGALWGIPIAVPFRLPGVLIPFFGFIFVGFFLAAVKFISKRIAYFAIVSRRKRDLRERARYRKIHVDPV